jgi:hypothetical protein
MKMLTWTALLVGMAGALGHGGETRQKLTVYLRFGSTNRYTRRFLAQDVADRMFADIGISLAWKTWQPAAESLQLSIVMELMSWTPENLRPGVFLDRIEKTKYSAYVLAYVMAEEITHIVEGVVRRSETGVMQAYWKVQDFCEMRRAMSTQDGAR